MRLRTCSPSIPFSGCSRSMCSRASSNNASSSSASRRSPQAHSSVQADGSMTPLVFVAYPVDDFDPPPAVTDHQYRVCAIPSLVDLVGAQFRVVLVGGPSRVMPFARSRLLRGPSLLVDAVNVHLTPMIGTNRFLRGRCRGARPKRNIYYNDDSSSKTGGQARRKAW